MSKQIYSFTINKKVKKEVTEEQGDTKITRTVEVDEPVKVVLKRPSRPEWKDTEFEYGKEYGACVRAGLLTKAMVFKMYSQDGFLEDQRKKALELADRLNTLQLDYQELSLKEKRDEDEEARLKQLNEEWSQKRLELGNLEMSLESMFANTAESRAEQQAIIHLALFQTYTEEGDQLKPVFRGETFEQKLKHHDALAESGNPFLEELVDKATHLIGLWYLGKATNPEDFDAVLAQAKELTEPEESVKEEKQDKEEATKEDLAHEVIQEAKEAFEAEPAPVTA